MTSIQILWLVVIVFLNVDWIVDRICRCRENKEFYKTQVPKDDKKQKN